jgi:hypothetical protein
MSYLIEVPKFPLPSITLLLEDIILIYINRRFNNYIKGALDSKIRYITSYTFFNSYIETFIAE